MKLIAPDYYKEFKCIASDCRHSCCIGWEIDIDEDTLALYDVTAGETGKRLQTNIERTEEGAHFRLGPDERCPFLNSEGLCDLIIGMGEESLCNICADHPRFRNYLSDRTEIGLGLCCEAAGKLILSRKEKVGLITLEDDGDTEELWEDETEALEMRRHILEILQDRSMPASERIFRMMDFAETEMPEFTWEQMEDILLGLERLDPAWEEYVRRLSGEMRKDLSGEEWETAFEQLAVYFLYRHFIGVSEDGDVTGRTGFIALSWMIIRRICESCAAENPDFGIDDLVEIARMYSSETEYSEENMDALRNLFAGE